MEPNTQSALRTYEGVIIVHPDATEKSQQDLFKKNETIIQSFGGSINHVDTWGKRHLANPIKKQRKAIYFHTTFEADPKAIAELERTMHINDQVLRFMHVAAIPGVTPNQFLEGFRNTISESSRREKERAEKQQKSRRPT